jgi:membrane-associated protease RseP (regulator of RpoE activity)
MSSTLTILGDAAVFLAVIAVLVLVHEFGHYVAARANGVRVEVFAIGLGPELFGVSDAAGTRWRLGAIPIGGYVRLFGRSETPLSPAEAASSFQHKRVGQRAAILAAGPLANFLFAFALLAVLLKLFGTPPAGPLHSGPGDLFALLGQAAALTWEVALATLRAIGQFLAGASGAGQLIGPLRAAEVSGALSREGWPLLALWLVMISVNIGVTNLFPIPSLDGGHLVFCLIEAIRGRPLDRRWRRHSARVGLALVFGLMAFATVNDLLQLGAAG